MQLVGHNNKQEKLVYVFFFFLQDWQVSDFVKPNVTVQR